VNGERGGYGIDDGSTATKTPTPLIDVPQGISFITEDQLEDQSIRQLNEALRYVPGVSLETGEGHRDEVFIRGQETTADFYLDGLRDDAQYYRPLYNIERVEVLKGANALIFGRGAGGGAINRVSKFAQTGDSFAAANASIDTFGAFALLSDVNQPLSNTIAVRLNGTYEEFDSHRDFYEGRFIGYSPTVTAGLGPATRLTATYSYDDDRRVVDRGVPSFEGGPLRGFDDTFFGDPDFNRSQAEVHIGRVRLDHEFAPGLNANATVQYGDYDKIYANILPTGVKASMVTLEGYQDATTRENLIGQANLVWEADGEGFASTLLLGIEASRQDTQNSRRVVVFDDNGAQRITTPLAERIVVPAFTLSPVSRSRESKLDTVSFYLQEQLEIGDHLELVAGLRWDRFDLDTVNLISSAPGDRVDERVSPRAGIIVKPVERLSLYASYTESFLPQAGDQFLLISPGDERFEPEKFTNYEVGVKWAPLEKVLVTAAAFRLDRTNTTAPDPDNTGLVVQTGESRVEGFEIGAVGSITDFWQANLGYTYLDGELRTASDFGAAGARLQQLPRHQITAWNRFDVTEQFGFGVGVIHQSDQFASFSNTVELPGYWRVDAAAYFTVSERISLQVNIENLLDESYFPSAHGNNNIQPAEPFSARFGVRVEL
jgi:catecholate siderophore receptor|tara:strand:- start:8747 stop:10723 length:1977 start_codon:yes stop_codon:yes gene_type:complete